MNRHLPKLDKTQLNCLFAAVYELPATQIPDIADQLVYFRYLVKVMQQFNYRYRPDDYTALHALADPVFHFQPHSEGTDLWLSLILAIQELYGFSEEQLLSVLKQVTVRK